MKNKLNVEWCNAGLPVWVSVKCCVIHTEFSFQAPFRLLHCVLTLPRPRGTPIQSLSDWRKSCWSQFLPVMSLMNSLKSFKDHCPTLLRPLPLHHSADTHTHTCARVRRFPKYATAEPHNHSYSTQQVQEVVKKEMRCARKGTDVLRSNTSDVDRNATHTAILTRQGQNIFEPERINYRHI